MIQETCPKNAFVVVTSGTEAKFFRNDGTPNAVKLRHVSNLLPQDLNDDGPSGVRPPESSDQETDEATFAKQLSHHLYTLAHKGEFDDLVLCADPETLGQMRPILHKEFIEKMSMTLNKTLINSPTDDIERSLSVDT